MAQRNQYYSIIFDEINRLTDAGKPIKVSAIMGDMTGDAECNKNVIGEACLPKSCIGVGNQKVWI